MLSSFVLVCCVAGLAAAGGDWPGVQGSVKIVGGVPQVCVEETMSRIKEAESREQNQEGRIKQRDQIKKENQRGREIGESHREQIR